MPSLAETLAQQGTYDIDPLTGLPRITPADEMAIIQSGGVPTTVGQGLAQAGSQLAQAIMLRNQKADMEEKRQSAAQGLAQDFAPAPSDPLATTRTGALPSPFDPIPTEENAGRVAQDFGQQWGQAKGQQDDLARAVMESDPLARTLQQAQAAQALPASARQALGMGPERDIREIDGQLVDVTDRNNPRVLFGQKKQGERYETVQSPYGRGGVGQRDVRTGKIVNYQRPSDVPAADAEPRPEDRYQNVGGRLFDLYARGGPRPISGPTKRQRVNALAADLFKQMLDNARLQPTSEEIDEMRRLAQQQARRIEDGMEDTQAAGGRQKSAAGGASNTSRQGVQQQAPVDLPAPLGDVTPDMLTPNTVYNTPMGPMQWTGSDFVSVGRGGDSAQ